MDDRIELELASETLSDHVFLGESAMKRAPRDKAMAPAIAFISYPKSGRTWMRYVFHLVGCQVTFTHAGHGTSRSEIGSPFVQVETSVLGAKNIFMFRNPLDTAVSLYFQVHKKDFRPFSHHYVRKYLKLAALRRLPPKDINQFVEHPLWGVENICRFNRSWLDFFGGRPNSLLVSYEKARENPERVITEVCAFCDVHSFDIKEVVRASSFESMRAHELRGRSKELMLHGLVGNDPETMKVRSGVVGGYRMYLEEGVIVRAGAICSQFQFDI